LGLIPVFILGDSVPLITEIEKDFRFEAAHFLPMVAPDHKCHSIHGHSYLVTIRAVGELVEPQGWVVDAAEITRACAPILSMLDHKLLNEIEGLENPTSENLAWWILRKAEQRLSLVESVTVSTTNKIRVTVRKTAS
jgi:6-pyruvoyltetrahydropterin/6-carboxytetrahydropterin synthase